MFVMILLMKRISPVVRGTVAAGLLATGGMGMLLTPGATDANVAKNADHGISKTARDAIACVVKVKDGDTLGGITNKLHVGKGDVVDARDAQDRPLASLDRGMDDALGNEAVTKIREGDKLTVVAGETACIAAGAEVVPVHIADTAQFAEAMRDIAASDITAARN
mgnify:CR=1 FL=1